VAQKVHYATYFDRHYLSRGLALYRSLRRHSPPFVLWVLCLDQETYDTLARLGLEGVELMPLPELEQALPALAAARWDRRAFEYYWTCGPAFLTHLLEQQQSIELLTYLDADLFFYSDPSPIYEELQDGAILLVESHWASSVPEQTQQKGIFNVGLLSFRRGEAALACLRDWREQCLEWCFDRVEPTRFGDQKYLDAWPARYPGVVISQHKGVGAAPWNLGRYRFSFRQGQVWVDDDPLIYYHFNRFKVLTPWLYDPAAWEHRQQLTPVLKRYVHLPYARELRAVSTLVRRAGGKIDRVDTVRFSVNPLLRLARMIRHRSFLVATDLVAL
jgi:hypothetical protein